jgi:hypothetical protein
MPNLHRFEGREVTAAEIRITNAGDGLSQAMKIDAVELKLGDKVYVVLEGEVSAIVLRPAKEGKSVVRVQTIRAGVATLVPEELVKDVLEEQRLAIEAAAGVTRLDFGDPDDPDPDDPKEPG